MSTRIMQVSSKIKFLAIMGVVMLSLMGCQTTAYTPTLTSIELQAIQTREFTSKKKVAFAATLSVFQDLGYIIEEADFDTGLITAHSPVSDRFVPFVGQVMENTKATAFVEQFTKSKSKIRLNFVVKKETSTGYGMKGGSDRPIEDAVPYQDAFNKIKKAIYVRKNL